MLNLSFKIIDEDTGKIELERDSRSWTQHILECLYLIMFQQTQAISYQVTSSNGTAYWISQSGADKIGRVAVGAGLGTFGIQVGLGTLPESITSGSLGNKIIHGTGAGQLSYGACTVGDPIAASGSVIWTVSRTFTNSTAGQGTINEIGMIGNLYSSSSPYDIPVCFARDVLDSPVTIDAAANKTVSYTFCLVN